MENLPKNIVRTGTDVCPDMVDEHTFGSHSSFVNEGQRYWLFRDPAGAELFTTYANRGEFRRKKGTTQ